MNNSDIYLKLSYNSKKSKKFAAQRIFNTININKTNKKFLKFLKFNEKCIELENIRKQINTQPVITSYLYTETDYYIQKIKEIVDDYIKWYKLDKFNCGNLPDYHNNLLKVAGNLYEFYIENTNYIYNNEQLNYFLNLRLNEFNKCKHLENEYYINEYNRELQLQKENITTRCNNIIWDAQELTFFKTQINRDSFNELIKSFGNIKYLLTFVDPIIYKEKLDKLTDDELTQLIYEYYSNGDNHLEYQQFIFGMGSDVRQYFPKIFDLPQLFKRHMNKTDTKLTCSKYINWSGLLNNIVTKCISINTTALFPIMFVLPTKDKYGNYDFRDKFPIAKSKLFSNDIDFIGIINIIYKKDFTKNTRKYRNTRYNKIEKRFWIFYLFKIINETLLKNSMPDPLTGDLNEYILINYNGQIVNHGDLFGSVPITYMELNQLTQKYKLYCYLAEINNVDVLYMTPFLTPLHNTIIKLLNLKYVNVIKNKDTFTLEII